MADPVVPPPSEPPPREGFSVVRYVSLGKIRDGDKLFLQLRPVEGPPEDVRLYALGKTTSGWFAGGVWDIETKGREVLSSSARYVGPWENAIEASAWRAADTAAEAAVRAAKLEAKDRTARLIDDTMAPLRREFRRMVGHERLAFEVLVLAALHRPIGRKESR